jgi:hypothetical protein
MCPLFVLDFNKSCIVPTILGLISVLADFYDIGRSDFVDCNKQSDGHGETRKRFQIFWSGNAISPCSLDRLV